MQCCVKLNESLEGRRPPPPPHPQCLIHTVKAYAYVCESECVCVYTPGCYFSSGTTFWSHYMNVFCVCLYFSGVVIVCWQSLLNTNYRAWQTKWSGFWLPQMPTLASISSSLLRWWSPTLLKAAQYQRRGMWVTAAGRCSMQFLSGKKVFDQC